MIEGILLYFSLQTYDTSGMTQNYAKYSYKNIFLPLKEWCQGFHAYIQSLSDPFLGLPLVATLKLA